MFLVNTRCFDRPLTGVERYAREITSRLGDDVRMARPGRPLEGWHGHAWEQIELPRLVNGDLLWSPANTGPLAVSAQVVTIHDLAPLEHPEWFEPRFAAWYRFLLPRLARRVARIITVSVFSKTRIVERLGVSEDRVTVIPNGVSERFNSSPTPSAEDVRTRHGLARPYVLTVGSLEPRKNLSLLLRAWSGSGLSDRGVELVVAGDARPTLRPVEVPRGDPAIRWLPDVNDEDLPGLYAGAVGLVFPSVYEGFGLPVLEAMACGTPVVCSDATALPEVAGDATLVVDPWDAESIGEGLRALVDDAERCGELRRRGRARVAQFGWDRAAAETRQVLRDVTHG